MPDSKSPFLEAVFSDGENAYSALMQQANVGIAQTDATGRYVRVNRLWCEMLGYREAELLQLRVSDVTHPDSMTATLAKFQGLLASGTHYVLEKKFQRKDGSAFWASATVSALRDREGKVTGLVALVLDLSHERRARRLVESQNQALQLMVSGVALELIFARIIAVVEEEAEGNAVGAILLLDAAAGCLRHGAAPSLPDDYNRAIDGIAIGPEVGTCGAAAARNEIIITPDISAAPGWQQFKHLPLALGLKSAWSMPIVSSTGAVLGTFGTYFRTCRRPSVMEIGMVSMLAKTAALAIERRQSEERLREATLVTEKQRRLYDTVLSNTPDFVYVFDRQHRFTYANNSLLRMWGKTWDEAIGRTCLELGYPEWQAAMHEREIDQVFATGRAIRGEVPFTGTEGRRVYDYIFAPVLGQRGEVEAIAGTARDVTEPVARRPDAAVTL